MFGSKKQAVTATAGVRLRGELAGHEGLIFDVAWSPDGTQLATCSEDESVRIWDWRAATASFPITFDGPVWSLSWSPDGQELVAVTARGACHEIRANPGFVARGEKLPEHVTGFAFSPDGRRFAAALDHAVLVQDVAGREPQQRIVHPDAMNLAWSPDGRDLCAVGATPLLMASFAVSARAPNITRLTAVEGQLYAVAWHPSGHELAVAGHRGDVAILSAHPTGVKAELEAHTAGVTALSYSADGRLLASKSWDGAIRLWRTDRYEPVATLAEPGAGRWLLNLAFHPREPVLATVDKSTHRVRLWEVDVDALLGVARAPAVAHYRNAKVVLVGDSGVGKSGLAMVLGGEKFAATESTHGRRVSTLATLEAQLDDGGRETREVLLWDLAGQPGYRLIHQLELGDVSAAAVVFDGKSSTDPFAGVAHWSRALTQAGRVTGNGVALAPRRFLVAARTDRGGVGVSRQRRDAILDEHRFDRYLETSARDGLGIDELRAALVDAIDWSALPRVTSTELFGRIKRFLAAEKAAGRLLATVDDLQRAFARAEGHAEGELRAEFLTCIGLVEKAGMIRRLSFGDFVLLQPERRDAYASAIVDTAREEPDGLGCIREQQVLDGRALRLSPDERIADAQQERLLLLATVEDLLRHEIAFREDSEDGTQLVFPSQLTRENPALPHPPGRSAVVSFEGPVLNLYATLAVRLARGVLFARRELWKNAAVYEARAGGRCGLFLSTHGDGKGELTLFFEGASEQTRAQFADYVGHHLERRANAGSVVWRRVIACPSCGYVLPDELLARKRQQGRASMRCPDCEQTDIALAEVSRSDDKPPSGVGQIDQAADRGRDRDAAAIMLAGKVKTGDFDVFLSHHSDDKPLVTRLARALRDRGLHPWLDSEQLPPGSAFLDVIQQAMPRVKCAAVVLGPSGAGPYHKLELDAFLRLRAQHGPIVIPVLLPGVARIPQDMVFLGGFTQVQFTRDVDEVAALDALEWTISGRRPAAR